MAMLDISSLQQMLRPDADSDSDSDCDGPKYTPGDIGTGKSKPSKIPDVSHPEQGHPYKFIIQWMTAESAQFHNFVFMQNIQNSLLNITPRSIIVSVTQWQTHSLRLSQRQLRR